jgi:arylsulfatase
MRRMGLVNCALPPLEPEMWTRWNSPDAKLFAEIGPGEVTRAVPWASLTAGQKSFQREKMAIHAAMITRMDTEIGRILQQVQTMGAERDTLVMFVSDNGASSEQLIRGDGHDRAAPMGSARSYLGVGPGWASCSNTPLRLHKSWVSEGGISSPLIVHWPNGIRERNQLRHNPCHFVDILPTVVDLAGGKTTDGAVEGAPPVAGRSLAPAFQKDGSVPHDFLYFNHSGNRALRVGDAKLLSIGTGAEYWRDWALYDMGKDRCELVNLAGVQPDRAQQLQEQWTKIDLDFEKRRESAPPTDKTFMQRGAPGRGGSRGRSKTGEQR